MSSKPSQKSTSSSINNASNRRRTLGAVNTNQGRRVSFLESAGPTHDEQHTLTSIMDEDVTKPTRPSSSSSSATRRMTMAAPRISASQEDKTSHAVSMTSLSTAARINRRKKSSIGGYVDHLASSTNHTTVTTSVGRPSMIPTSGAAAHTATGTDMTLEVPSIQDKAYFNSCIKTLVTYLNTHGFYNSTNTSSNHWHNLSSKVQHPPSSTAQKNSTKDQPCPSSKEFHNIVTFLLRKLDPTFFSSSSATSSSSTGIKVEEEIHFAFKILGYPHNISKTTLAAAGSSHTWPTLVQALAWLVQVLEYHDYGRELERQEEIRQQEKDEIWLQELCTKGICPPQGSDAMLSMTEERRKEILSTQETLMDILSKQALDAFYKFLQKAYPLFLLERDDEVDQLEISMFLDRVEQGNMVVERLMEDVAQWNSILMDGTHRVTESVQDLPQWKKKLQSLLSDSEKFNQLVSQYDEHKSSLRSKVDERENEWKEKTRVHDALVEQIRALKLSIQTQGLTVDMARTMEAECGQAEKSLEHLRILKNEHKNAAYQNEMETNKLMTSLDSIISGFKEKYIQLWNGEEDPVLSTMNSTNNSLQLSNVVQMKLIRECVHEEDPKLFLGGTSWKDVSEHLLKTKAMYTEKTAQLRRDKLTWMTRQETSDELKKEYEDSLDIVLASKKRWEDTLQRETEEQETALAARQKELSTLEERIRYLRDPIDLESDFSSLQIRHSQLLALKRQKGNDHAIKKKAILQEFNEALRLCAEHRQFQSEKLMELNDFLSSKLHRDPESTSICLSPEQETLLKSSEY